MAGVYLLHASVSAACGPCQTAGPTSPAAQPAWLAALKKERESVLASINYTGGVFANPSLGWTQGAYIQPQVHPYDRFFFDEASGNYTVDRFLADLEKRYGGVDAVLLWPTYTNLGIDDRNQFDFFRTMPGGLDGVKQVTALLHAAGVRVLWPYNPWDTGTRREALDDQHTLAALLKQTGGDGFNGDTMGSIPRSFWAAALQDSYPIAFEPEDGGTDASLNWATMGWGYWLYPRVPQVDRFKYLTRGKFMTNVCDRWATRKTDNLQSVWFNGAGYESWENVWGTWNGIVPRDAEALRRVSTMLRFFGGRGGLLQAEEWEPHTPSVLTPGVFGSRFPNGTHTLYTLVNRAGTALPEVHISLPEVQLPTQGDSSLVEESHREAMRYFDCYRGVELMPHAAPPSPATHGSHAPPRGRAAGTMGATATPLVISLPLEKEGYGCVLGARGAAAASAPPLVTFLRTMAALSVTPLQHLSAEWRYLPQALVPITATRTASAPPAGMVAIPAAANFSFVVRGIEIEGDDKHGVDVQYPWEIHPQREHAHSLPVAAFYMDKYPATNANYSTYLKATGYTPRDPYHWLRQWGGAAAGLPCPLSNARARLWRLLGGHAALGGLALPAARGYCAWAHGGARLPHEWEWQYAAQGTDGRPYPWGASKVTANYPPLSTGTTCHGPQPVAAHAPGGDSPFGVSDMVGNVWQYTDEVRDEHTRAVILRGGSNYRPSGSSWYFPNQIELSTHNKYFLFSDRYERAATIGVRCVKDAA